jgi:hypothetical protein
MHFDVRHGVFGQVFADLGDNPSFDPSSWKARRRSASVRGGAAMTSAGTSCVRTTSSKAATDLRVRNKANVHSRAKRSLAKVCGAAESGLSLLGAML